METKSQSLPHRVNEDFEPHCEWTKEQGIETLMIYLPGFKKEQLRVQVTSSRNLRVSGERAVGENKWRRFLKEFPIPSNCDINGITAKFESGILYVKHPKQTTPVETQGQKVKTQSSAEAEKGSSSQQQQAAAGQEVASKASNDKQQPNGKGAVGESNGKKHKEPSAGKSSTGIGADADSVVKKSAQDKNESDGLGEPEKKDKATSSNPETLETMGGIVENRGRQRPTEDGYKQGVGPIGGWVTAFKGRSKFLSWVVSALLVLILALYLRKVIIKMPGESANQEF